MKGESITLPVLRYKIINIIQYERAFFCSLKTRSRAQLALLGDPYSYVGLIQELLPQVYVCTVCMIKERTAMIFKVIGKPHVYKRSISL